VASSGSSVTKPADPMILVHIGQSAGTLRKTNTTMRSCKTPFLRTTFVEIGVEFDENNGDSYPPLFNPRRLLRSFPITLTSRREALPSGVNLCISG
jgi:hypothetical protein